MLDNFTDLIRKLDLFQMVPLYDSNDRLLKDSDLLSTLKTSTSLFYIPIRFTLFNRITSLDHCLCSSSSSIQQKTLSYLSSSTIIKRETIDQILSTCSLIPPSSSSVILPCLSLSSYSSELSNSISIVNLLTPPLSHSSSSYLNENNLNDQSIFDEITSQFGEICPPLPKNHEIVDQENCFQHIHQIFHLI
ncbi:unnamed protein product [Rotaria sp. Silwood1]|nr:unnamed protein product [Rotaria sp. Silwood1]CAF3350786.1 unnamed protein product [Rotaria sp. Silwood1]CAF3420992.1 unnamed protein product [Rotaria sp. Silwood1]CAF3478262.1 unnamed protein product [Rotaria sp. Silwood1]CAF4627578.1 unnamed protein product [Rotaria sp. Silwood1]